MKRVVTNFLRSNNLSRRSCSTNIVVKKKKDVFQDFVFCQTTAFERREPPKPRDEVITPLPDFSCEEKVEEVRRTLPSKSKKEDVFSARKRVRERIPLFDGPVPWQIREQELAQISARRTSKEQMETFLSDLKPYEIITVLQNAPTPSIVLILSYLENNEEKFNDFNAEEIIHIYHAYSMVSQEILIPERFHQPSMLSGFWFDSNETIMLIEALSNLDLLTMKLLHCLIKEHVSKSGVDSVTQKEVKTSVGFSGDQILRVVKVMGKALGRRMDAHPREIKRVRDMVLRLQDVMDHDENICVLNRFCTFSEFHSAWYFYSSSFHLGKQSSYVSDALAKFVYCITNTDLRCATPHQLTNFLHQLSSNDILSHPDAQEKNAHQLVVTAVESLTEKIPALDVDMIHTVRESLKEVGYRDDYFEARLAAAEARFNIE